MRREHHLPVLVVAGYLGAGKTSLLNDLLRRARALDRRVAVLVNDFGALAIDRDLIEAADDAMIALDGGCVCCTFGADLLGTLATLSQRAPGIERIVVEASGVALPAPLAATIDLSLAHRTEAVVVVADAETLAERLADRYVGDTVSRQLAAADQVLLTKTESLAAAACSEALRRAADAAPQAAVIAAPAGSAARAGWLDALLLDALPVEAPPDVATPGASPAGPQGSTAARRAAAGGADAYLGTAAARSRASGAHPFTTLTWQADRPLDSDAIVAALHRHREAIVRSKGIIADGDAGWYVIQGVGARVTRTPYAGAVPPTSPSRLVCFVLDENGGAPPQLAATLAALGLEALEPVF
ncbi:MAG: GTP-binding protein [Lautropia sp.]